MTKGRRPSVSGRSLDPRLQLVHLSKVLLSGNMNRDMRWRTSRRQTSSWAGDQTANGFDIARRGERQYHPFRRRGAHNENHPSARGGGASVFLVESRSRYHISTHRHRGDDELRAAPKRRQALVANAHGAPWPSRPGTETADGWRGYPSHAGASGHFSPPLPPCPRPEILRKWVTNRLEN